MLEKRRLRKNMVAVFEYLKGCHMENGLDLFFQDPEGRMRNSKWN